MCIMSSLVHLDFDIFDVFHDLFNHLVDVLHRRRSRS